MNSCDYTGLTKSFKLGQQGTFVPSQYLQVQKGCCLAVDLTYLNSAHTNSNLLRWACGFFRNPQSSLIMTSYPRNAAWKAINSTGSYICPKPEQQLILQLVSRRSLTGVPYYLTTKGNSNYTYCPTPSPTPSPTPPPSPSSQPINPPQVIRQNQYTFSHCQNNQVTLASISFLGGICASIIGFSCLTRHQISCLVGRNPA